MAPKHMADGKKRGLKNGSVFCFFDESGFADRPHVVRTWSLRGQTPIVRSRGGWKRITAAGMIVFRTANKRAPALAWLSKRGMRKAKVLTILCDGLPAHRAKVVRRFIEENRHWLTVHRFPAYAPELNPQEFLWSAVKRKDMGNFCPKTVPSLRAKVYRSLKQRGTATSFLKGCLKASGLLSVKELGEGQ